MKKQKDAVVELVKSTLGGRFTAFQDNALSILTDAELELIKAQIAKDIGYGYIDYSKNKTDINEVRTYARSMVMNHLKKAKELNGNQVSNTNSVAKTTKKETVKKNTINLELLPDYLQDFVRDALPN